MTPRQGISFTLEGVDELTYMKVLRDVTRDATFSKPLQIQAHPPAPGDDGRITIAFEPQDRDRAFAATQRLKTIILRYGVQIDSVST